MFTNKFIYIITTCIKQFYLQMFVTNVDNFINSTYSRCAFNITYLTLTQPLSLLNNQYWSGTMYNIIIVASNQRILQ